MKKILQQVVANRNARTDLTLTTHLNRFQRDEAPRQFFDLEKELIDDRKRVVARNKKPTDKRSKQEKDLTGLALSGGGIRSATFCLGALQVFEGKGLMPHVDYMSSVSGGGFIGAAYSAWRYRKTMYEMKTVAAKPHDPDRPPCPVQTQKPPADLNALLLHLRKFAHYLSPRLGLISTEPWRIVGAFVRNLVIQWLVMVSAVFALFAALLLAQRHLYAVTVVVAVIGLLLMGTGLARELSARRCINNRAHQSDEPCPMVQQLLQAPHLILFAGLAMCGLSAALGFVASTRIGFPDWTPLSIFSTGLAPLSTWLDSLISVEWFMEAMSPPKDTTRFNPGLTAALLLLAAATVLVTICGVASDWRWRPRHYFMPTVRWLGLGLGVVVYLGLWWVLAANQNSIFKTWESVPLGLWEFLSFTTVSGMEAAWAWVWQAALAIFGFAIILSLFIAVFNREMDREEREWATRLVSIALMTGCAWLVAAGLVTLSAELATWVYAAQEVGVDIASGLAATGFWIGISTWAARLASSTSVKAVAKEYWKQLLLKLGPPLFLAGLVLLCGFSAALLVLWLGGADALWVGYELWWLLGAALAVFAVAGSVLDSNEFSLHGFYRDRIVRSYLGASNSDSPAPDSTWNIRTDDIPLHCLTQSVRYGGAPFPIINTAVNLFGSKDLQVQQRSCDSFVLTPTGCGSWATNYAPMPGLYLGSAVAASGAAVSSNMGMATRGAALAALMTVFNLRLGFWFGNPCKNAQRRKRPRFAPWLLLLEGFSLTNENREFVNLSDGGHFDNLGLYELIRRRCKFIVVLDAESDEGYGFESLERVIRFARIDFGVDIDLDFQKIAPLPGEKYAQTHWALGSIDYSQVTPGTGHDRGLSPHGESQMGYLLYIKSSLCTPEKNAHVSRDVLGYSLRNPSFPHEATSDQFFSEAQFESYRELGSCIAEKLLEDWSGETIAELFKQNGAKIR